MFLQLINIQKKFEEKTVLKNINLTLEQGQLLCLIGASGCGKTTLLNIIGGFLESEGSIVLDNENIEKLEAKDRQVATVFQSYGLFPNKTVLENVSYGLKFKNIAKVERIKLAEEILDKVGLLNLKNKSVVELSGGEKQRVALARSLVLKPKLLLLDEPFSNLDSVLKNTLRKELKQLQKKFKTTMILVTHDRDDVFYLADSVAIMDEGKIIQQGKIEDVYKFPNNKLVARYFGEENDYCGKKVRPENLKIRACSDGDGVVSNRKFLGAITHYEVIVEGKILKIITLSSDEQFQIGERVNVEIK